MEDVIAPRDEDFPDPHHDVYHRTVFGFWIYLMTDCVLFGILFAVYAVLHRETFGGPSAKDLFEAPFVLKETLVLLTSSFTSGLGTLAAFKNEKAKVYLWYGITFLLGLTFLVMELQEFHHLIQEGYSWRRSAFLTSFFTLVGTHGAHITVGLIWMFVMLLQLFLRGIKPVNLKRFACLSLFWHFLDVIWIFIFTFVYLMGIR